MEDKITESASRYQSLESMSIEEILININEEDKTVAYSVEKAIPQINLLLQNLLPKLKSGGRLFYLGSGTSGRLGVVDASECPPTYGVPQGLVVGIISGGDVAIRKAVEFAEDDLEQGWIDLLEHTINQNDVVIGITASGSTPYVIGAIKKCVENKILTACLTCNSGSELARIVHFPIEVIVGAEFVTGSTRMKAGTAQKLVLNMISTSAMIGLGKIKGNKMIDMQLSNNKLIDRGTKMIMEELKLKHSEAADLLKKHGSVRKAIENYKK